ncbi:hypothetical protein [Desulfurobacterium crinifex]
MRITPEAYLATMFRFLGNGLREDERADVAICILDELEKVAGIKFSSEERKELTSQVADLLNQGTTIQDVGRFINFKFGKSKNPSVSELPSINIYFLCCCPSKKKYQLTLGDGTKIPLLDKKSVIGEITRDFLKNGVIRKAITGGNEKC